MTDDDQNQKREEWPRKVIHDGHHGHRGRLCDRLYDRPYGRLCGRLFCHIYTCGHLCDRPITKIWYSISIDKF